MTITLWDTEKRFMKKKHEINWKKIAAKRLKEIRSNQRKTNQIRANKESIIYRALSLRLKGTYIGLNRDFVQDIAKEIAALI